jgi:hypothetical protein
MCNFFVMIVIGLGVGKLEPRLTRQAVRIYFLCDAAVALGPEYWYQSCTPAKGFRVSDLAHSLVIADC